MSTQATSPATSRLSNLRPSVIAEALNRIDWTYMPGDHMLGPSANHIHYREVGESAARVIYASLLLANVDAPGSILDFGCGSGRVTRWLRAMYPDAAIEASDLRTDSLAFISKQFGVNTWQSDPDPRQIEAPNKYDLIWCGSVLTHLPEEVSSELLRKFFSWLNPNGICIITTHGRRMLQNMEERRLRYIAADKEKQFVSEVETKGYAYAPYQGQNIGVSACSTMWVLGKLNDLGGRVITISEHAWDKHQDVVALQAPGPR